VRLSEVRHGTPIPARPVLDTRVRLSEVRHGTPIAARPVLDTCASVLSQLNTRHSDLIKRVLASVQIPARLEPSHDDGNHPHGLLWCVVWSGLHKSPTAQSPTAPSTVSGVVCESYSL